MIALGITLICIAIGLGILVWNADWLMVVGEKHPGKLALCAAALLIFSESIVYAVAS